MSEAGYKFFTWCPICSDTNDEGGCCDVTGLSDDTYDTIESAIQGGGAVYDL